MVAGLRGGRTGRLIGRWLLAALVLGLVGGAGGASAAAKRTPRADLTVRSAAVKVDAGRITATVVAANSGRRRAAASTGMLSWKPAGGLVVTVLQRFRVAALAPGARRSVRLSAKLPAGSSGAFAATVCLDVRAEVRETNGKNNCRSLGKVTVPAAGALGEVRTSPPPVSAVPAAPPSAVGPGSGSSTPPVTPPPPVDNGAPQTSISRGPVGTTNDRTATFLFTASEVGALFACRIDGGAWAWCTPPAVFPALPDGPHTFEVRATGAAGTSDLSPASRSWTVDGTAPETTITGGPPPRVGSGSASFAFTSSEPGGSFECRVDTGAWGFCDSPEDVTGLAAGPHTFQVRATDAAGNRDATPASRAWTVDLSAPQTSLGPSADTTGPSTTFTFTTPEADATFECRLDDGDWADCTSPAALTGLADGVHSFEVRAVDAAGNADASPALREWAVDATAPETVIDSGPSGEVPVGTADFTFSSADAGATFECRLDDAPWTPCASPLSLSGLLDGAHTFEVRATDTLGNVDVSPASQAWTVTTVP